MGSFKGNNGDRNSQRRGKAGQSRKQAKPALNLEALEARQLLSVGDQVPFSRPTSNDLADVKNGPLAKGGQDIVTLYSQYQQHIQQGGNGGFQSPLSEVMYIKADKVGVSVSVYGDLSQFISRAKNLGMEVVGVESTMKIVDGYLPIAQLPTLANMVGTVGMNPIYKPISYVGAVDNQANQAMRADQARQLFNVDGTGVTVGVLSDSVSRYQGGLADSVATGDLPNNVNVLLDEPVGGNNSDEGRAMLEQIYDMAPGASLAFHTAFISEANFAAGIRALAAAGSQVIVDDVGYAFEPMFQDGIIAQAVTEVVNNGAIYFSSAGNSADHGYESAFRGTNATVAGVGAGRYMDFDPGPGVVTGLPVTFTQGGNFVFQYDNPFYTANGVTTDMDVFIVNPATGAIVAQGITNNIANQIPVEFLTGIPASATPYEVVIRVTTGTDVGRVRFREFGSSITVSQQFGTAGSTSYPTTFGHSVAAEAIGVGAVPYFNAPPFSNVTPVLNQDFSSDGPVNIVFNPDGTRKGQIETRQKPDLSGTDANNTTFFIPGFDIEGDGFPNFTGTSSAAPNLAAVAALMKQLVPSATKADIQGAMQASTLPLNGSPAGVWDVRGGFGLVQADAALAAIDTLRVVTTTPANGQTLNTSPGTIVVTFSRDVDPTTVQATDLVFTQFPVGVTVTVGQPLILSPTTISFPINIAVTGTGKANGNYAFTLADGVMTSVDGKPLAAYTASYAVNDIINPRITNTRFVGRQVVVQFSEAMRPDTVTAAGNVRLDRLIGGVWQTVSVPGLSSITYDPMSNQALLDLSALLQQDLPSGTYRLFVSDQVTDLVGNKLDGEFNGSFPSGDAKPLPPEDVDNDPFIQQLNNVVLRAPQFSNVGLDQTTGITSVNPRILGTTYNRNQVVIQFNQDMDPATINRTNITLSRRIGGALDNLNTRPQLTVTYDSFTRTATVDMSQLSDTDVPVGSTYELFVSNLVTDEAGNRLDGEFDTATSGVFPPTRNTLFPTGDGKPVAQENLDNDSFRQILPRLDTSGPAVYLSSDSGIAGDQNTDVTRPRIVGQVVSSFPGSVADLTVVAEFNALHSGTFSLQVGPGGRGFSGTFDVQTTTDASGRFVIQAPANLPDGQHTVRIIVVGQSDQPPLPGLATRIDRSFRIDTTNPVFTPQAGSGALRPGLTTLTFDVVDSVLPSNPFDPLVVPTSRSFPALDPASANNISNYSLINLGADRLPGGVGANADVDYSSFIIGAHYVTTQQRTSTTDPFRGEVTLSFAEGLPQGLYQLVARRPQPGFTGITDAAGNPIDGDPGTPGAQDMKLLVDLQPTPVYITSLKAVSPIDDLTSIDLNNPSSFVLSDPRSYFETLTPGALQRATAPPEKFLIDFSNPLNAAANYSNAVQLYRSANNTPGARPDGDFGTDPTYGAIGPNTLYTRVSGLTVSLVSAVAGSQLGDPGYMNRLVVELQAGTSLPPDIYRLFLPNAGSQVIIDQFGNQLDGEFLGNPGSTGGFETLLPTGVYRNGLSGDGLDGGTFQTAYTVVPTGNVIFARPDYQFDPNIPDTIPDGSAAKPYPTLAPEADPLNTALHGGNLNSTINAGTNFNPRFDLNQNGQFDPSAFYAAQQAATRGPVVIAALPGTPQIDPFTGQTSQETFVLAAPFGLDGSGNPLQGNASVPYMTSLVFEAGSALKLQNASLFVQNQGTSLQVRGGLNPQDQVHFTSFSDDSIGGDSNDDGLNGQNNLPSQGGRAPTGGDWGGLVLRNFNQGGPVGEVSRATTFPVDGRLKGLNSQGQVVDARSGADDLLSFVNHADVRYGGGAVPQTSGFRYDAVTLFNARPSLSNTRISETGGATAAQAAISADVDSLREDAIARGLLVRRVTVENNSLNGIWVRPNANGIAEPTNATLSRFEVADESYTLDDPLPYLFTSQLVLGETSLQDTGGQTTTNAIRLYIQPGMLLKFQRGAGIVAEVLGTSINIGDRTYMEQFDADPLIAPLDSNNQINTSFRPNTKGDAGIIFTSLFDDAATTFHRDPVTGLVTTIVPVIDSDNGGPVFQPAPGNVPAEARWGGLTIDGGVIGVIDEATFRYGGGPLNTRTGTDPLRNVLTLAQDAGAGVNVSITNNDFLDNLHAPIWMDPNGLLAADPLRPLLSGNPYFRNNVMQRNVYNGLYVQGDEISGGDNNVSLFVNSVWDDTDITYILRGTIQLAGDESFAAGRPDPFPDAVNFGTELTPAITLTLQSAMADTMLADGSRIARPGETLLIKLLNAQAVPGDAINGSNSDSAGGAGFIVGVDDGSDPDADRLVDAGWNSSIRIVGIGADETSGQQRVPVVITSLNDDSVGRTVRGVDMFDAFPTGAALPQSGDGGLIYFGALSLTDYNLLDPRGGSIIDNADIRYLTRIEFQSGGISDVYDTSDGDTGLTASDGVREQKLGLVPITQFNQAKAMTIANSNLADFSQVGVLVQNGFNMIGRDVGPLAGFAPIDSPNGFLGRTFRSGFRGQPVDLFLYGNTIVGMPVGVRVSSDTTQGPLAATDGEQEPFHLILVNNTFDDNDTAVNTIAPAGTGGNAWNSFSSVRWLAMNNIFSNSTVEAITAVGQQQGSQAQYNLFYNNASNVSVTGTGTTLFPNGGFGGNNGVINGNPRFTDAANGDFTLGFDSAAIDSSRSELGPINWGNILQPATGANGIRNVTGRLGGLTDFAGNFQLEVSPGVFALRSIRIGTGDVVLLPGSDLRTFPDQWVAALPPALGGATNVATGAGANAATFGYRSIQGERDQNGVLRQDDPGRANLGFGGRPFFDAGAFEYRQFLPPRITDVLAVLPGTTTPIDFYTEGGIASSTQSPRLIQFKFDRRLDNLTVTSSTFVMESAGGDGIFSNRNSAGERLIDLSGKLSYDPGTNIVTVNLTGVNPALASDLYRITVRGDGSDVVRDPQGLPIDGENTTGNSPTGVQQPLPSGDNKPGGNFYLFFTIDNLAPGVVPNTFRLDIASDLGQSNTDRVTSDATPSFSGTIQDLSPTTNPLFGQRVILDLAGPDKVFGTADDILNAGTALTTAQGTFLVTYGQDLANTGLVPPTLPPAPDTLGVDRGPDDLLGTADDVITTYDLARVRVIDPSGNTSDPNDVNAQTRYVLDTAGPRVLSSDPVPSTQAVILGNQIQVAIVVNETINPATVNGQTVTALRAGIDGLFNTADDVVVVTSNFTVQTLPDGSQIVRLVLSGSTVNDLYRVTFSGTGNGVQDVAGNNLDGEFTGIFPTGDGTPGGNFELTFLVYTPNTGRLVFVDDDATGLAPSGSRFDPYPTITQAIAAAGVGDIVAVLPGVYAENVVLKSLVRVLSTDLSSSDTFFMPGSALGTVILSPQRGVAGALVSATDLISLPTLPTELSGFSVMTSLLNNQIAAGTVGIAIVNSEILVSKNYVLNAEAGIDVQLSAAVASTPRIESNVLVGNLTGLQIRDLGAGAYRNSAATRAINNTIVFNTTGTAVSTGGTVQTTAVLANNIYYRNFSIDAVGNRTGSAIQANAPGRTVVAGNMFLDNGVSSSSSADDTIGVGGTFNPAVLSTTLPDAQGNFLGNPRFTSPRDPRPTPNGQGPAVFFTDASFDLASNSAAIDTAIGQLAPTLDFLSRSRVDIPGKGFLGTGPADAGAFEFNGLPAQGFVFGNGAGSSVGNPTVFSPTAGQWSTVANNVRQTLSFGQSGDIPISGDFNGDGVADVAVYRPSNGMWLISTDGKNVTKTQAWGVATDLPVPLDWDGDNKTDIAVYRPSTNRWYVLPSSGAPMPDLHWGGAGDMPIVGDFDGDNRDDIGIYRPSTNRWYIRPSNGKAMAEIHWGGLGDQPIVGDFDGDGKADAGIFRPSTRQWFIRNSSGKGGNIPAWGGPGDIPAPADYDRDGKFDIAIFRPSSGQYIVAYSSGQGGYPQIPSTLPRPTDVPVQAPLAYRVPGGVAAMTAAIAPRTAAPAASVATAATTTRTTAIGSVASNLQRTTTPVSRPVNPLQAQTSGVASKPVNQASSNGSALASTLRRMAGGLLLRG